MFNNIAVMSLVSWRRLGRTTSAIQIIKVQPVENNYSNKKYLFFVINPYCCQTELIADFASDIILMARDEPC